MDQVTVSVCLITRNESSQLTRCIESIRSLADEIIVVDTGSTDNTVEIAKALGAVVYSTVWEHDFSKARNVGLEHCTKDWILVIDADEVFEKEHVLPLKSFIQDTSYEALYVNLINWIGKEAINENPSLRLFRNRKSYRFQGRLHEQIYYSIRESCDDQAFCSTSFKLNHYGYDHNVIDMSKKIERNIDILNRYEDKEKDGLFYFSLGSEYLKIKKDKEAKNLFMKSLSFNDQNKGIRTYVAISLIKVCLDLKQYATALEYIQIFIKEYPDFRDLYFLKCMAEYELGKYSQSYISLSVFKRLPLKTQKYPSFNFEQINDIESIYTHLERNKIVHNNQFMATIVEVHNVSTDVIHLIKQVNEISKNTFVISKRSDQKGIEVLAELGAIIIEENIFNEEALIEYVMSKGNVDHIILLKDKMKLTREACIEMIKDIENNALDRLKVIGCKVIK